MGIRGNGWDFSPWDLKSWPKEQQIILLAYGFNYNSLQMLQNYLSNRTERTKNNDAHRNGNSNDTYLFAVPQGFLLGPTLFVIASYADNITICASSSSLDAVISKLNKQEENTNNLFQWFRNYHTKDNADKRHLNHTKAKTDKLNLLVTDHPPVTDNYEVSANVNEFEIEDSKKEKY